MFERQQQTKLRNSGGDMSTCNMHIHIPEISSQGKAMLNEPELGPHYVVLRGAVP